MCICLPYYSVNFLRTGTVLLIFVSPALPIMPVRVGAQQMCMKWMKISLMEF